MCQWCDSGETMSEPEAIRGYELLEEIGRGAFATVWRARQPAVARDVAVKRIHPELSSEPDFVRRFEVEARLVARIEHPHVVPLIDFWRDAGSAQLVMQYLRGGSLERRLDDGPLGSDATRRLLVEVGSALAAAHDRAVVHRDVKPGNVLFDEHGYAYLTDFGIAIANGRDDSSAAARSPGTPHYAAPEQLQRAEVGPAADQYALGLIAWECLVGPPPLFDATSGPELFHRQLTEVLPDLRDFGVDPALADAVAIATAKDPRDRFGSMRSLLSAIEPVGRAASRPIPTRVENPFRGLRAFDEADASTFFGRSRMVHELLTGFRAGEGLHRRAAIVTGASGSGKSSLVRAGLLPALRRGAVPGSDSWFVTTTTPGDDPFGAVADALASIGTTPADQLDPVLRSGPRGLVRAVRLAVGSGATVLLVIDQLEELFTVAPPDEADAFLETVAIAIGDATSGVRLAATLRADFYDRPLQHAAFAPLLKVAAVDVTPLEPDELEEALTEPTHRAGMSLEPGLLGRIVADTAGRASPLPLLQYAMAEVFDRRSNNQLTLRAYDELGGVGGALAARAERLHEDATDAERAALRRIFGRLAATNATGVDVRVRVRVPDLGDDPSVDRVLSAFGEARLLTFDRDSATRVPTVEVAHEELLRSWPRLAAWLDEDEDLLRRVERLGTRADEWDGAGWADADLLADGRLAEGEELVHEAPDRLRPVDRDLIDASRSAADRRHDRHARRVRNLRRLVGVAGVAVVVALVAAVVALGQRNRANDEAGRAESAAMVADEEAEAARAAAVEAEVQTLISRSAALGVDDRSLGVLLALEAHRRAPGPSTERAVLRSLVAIGPRIYSQPSVGADGGPCDSDGFLGDDGAEHYAVVDGRKLRVGIGTGAVEDLGPLADPCGAWLLFDHGARELEVSADRRTFTIRNGGDAIATIEREATSDAILTSRAGPPRVLLGPAGFATAAVEFQLYDADSGAAVGPPVGGLIRPGIGFSPDGRYLAVGSGTPVAPDGGGPLRVLDQETGAEVSQVDLPSRAQGIGFDTDRGELLVGTAAGLLTVDITAGEIVGSTPLPGLVDIRGVFPLDGQLVAVVTAGRLELVDRELGLLDGGGVELRAAAQAARRPDGTLLVHGEDHRNEILDLDGGPLVEESVTTGATTTWVEVANGRVAATNVATGVVDVVDLATDERVRYDLRRPDGSPGAAIVASPLPEPGRLLTIAADASVSRWQDGEFVERFLPSHDPGATLEGGAGGDGSLAVLVRVGERFDAVVLSVYSEFRERFRITGLSEVATVVAAADGGVHVAFEDGRIETYGPDGELIGTVGGGVCCTIFGALDPVSGVAVFGGDEGFVRLDPAEEVADALDLSTSVANVGVLEGGDRLVVGRRDGTVQLWDASSSTLIGTLHDATSNGLGTPAPAPDSASVWVPVNGRVLRLPVEPSRWITLACETVGRTLTEAEWRAHVPTDAGERSDPISACDDA